MVNLGQFPENRNQQNRDYEQKELGNHLLALRARNWKRSGILLLVLE
jgi:hypothetical protein